KTKNADNLLGQQFRVVRTATYNYDEYYLLEDENGVSLGWMYAGDLTTSEYVPEIEQEEDLEDQTPAEPEVPAEPELEESDETADEDQAPEEDESNDVAEDDNAADEQQQVEEDTNTGSEEGSVEESNDATDEEQSDEQPAEPANPETPEEAAQPEDDAPKNTDKTDDSTEESAEESAGNGNQEEPANTDTSESADDVEDESNNDNPVEENSNEETDESDQESTEQEAEVSDDNAESAEDTNQDSEENEEPTVSETTEDGEVSSSLVDSATGVRVVSATDELDGKSIVVTVMNPSNAIGAAHDLYDIHILDENGSLYSLNNPVTVYLPANGYVSNVYYLGDIGETLEAVNYTTADGYAVFEVNSFSQYAVVYGNENEDNTTIAPVTGNQGTGGEDMAADQTNEHPTVYTEKDVNTESEAAAAGSSNNANQNGSGEAKETEEEEMLPDTGVAEQSTTVFAAILAALGLGFLVKRRKTTEK
ncbi:MAG: LPXTG cell wall anchor domain-containing protein, partial [Jeotgalicoccus sp.]|nr:LPXTG cell wall anchor domain-containing protein [Jeotgalicoccus sp.]